MRSILEVGSEQLLYILFFCDLQRTASHQIFIRPIQKCLIQMIDRYSFCTFHISDCPCHTKHTVIRSCSQMPSFKQIRQSLLFFLSEHTVWLQGRRWNFRVETPCFSLIALLLAACVPLQRGAGCAKNFLPLSHLPDPDNGSAPTAHDRSILVKQRPG